MLRASALAAVLLCVGRIAGSAGGADPLQQAQAQAQDLLSKQRASAARTLPASMVFMLSLENGELTKYEKSDHIRLEKICKTLFAPNEIASLISEVIWESPDADRTLVAEYGSYIKDPGGPEYLLPPGRYLFASTEKMVQRESIFRLRQPFRYFKDSYLGYEEQARQQAQSQFSYVVESPKKEQLTQIKLGPVFEYRDGKPGRSIKVLAWPDGSVLMTRSQGAFIAYHKEGYALVEGAYRLFFPRREKMYLLLLRKGESFPFSKAAPPQPE